MKYEEWVQNQAEQRSDFGTDGEGDYDEFGWDPEEEYDEEEFASYESYFFDKVDKAKAERTRTRLEREGAIIGKWKQVWQEEVVKQEQKKDMLQLALTKLFKNMPNLTTIEIRKWEVNLYDIGIEDEVRRVSVVYTSFW